MKTFNNELSVHRGETFSMDKIIQNKDGSPYIVSNKLQNPYILVSVSTTRYEQNNRYLLNQWLPLNEGIRFLSTEPLDLKSICTDEDGTNPKYNSFDEITERILIPGSLDKYYIASGYVAGEFVYYDYDSCVFYLEDENGVRDYRHWDINKSQMLKYEFRVTCPFTQNITTEWMEQSYVYSISLVSGELPAEGVPPFARIDTVQPLLPATKLSVLSSINGGF